MRLFDAIVDANHRALGGDAGAGLRPGEFASSLPVVVLTCIDPRLNPLMPEVLGIPEEQFIWLRNAGNIIFDPTSSMTRTLALACAIKGGKEIAIVGHTDCKVRQTSTLELTERFRALGVDRSRLPDNLNDFFGLFASERQNVIRGVGFVRQSPLIGPRVPVHGLLVDIQTGRLEWIVNGYQTLDTSATQTVEAHAGPAGMSPLAALPEFNLGEMKFPEAKIGEAATAPPAESPAFSSPSPLAPTEAETRPAADESRARFDPLAMFKVVGDDQKVYGPVPGRELEQWLAEGRVKLTAKAQRIGYRDWRPLSSFVRAEEPPEIPVPPPLRVAKADRPVRQRFPKR